MLEDQAVANWLRTKSDKTKKDHLQKFPKWLQFVNMSPSEQIAKRISDLQSSDPRERHFFEDKWIDYKTYLEKQYTSVNTIRSYLNVVKSFFSSNRFPLTLGKTEQKIELASQDKVIEQACMPRRGPQRKSSDMSFSFYENSLRLCESSQNVN